jgi:chromosome segregation ATPase
MIRIWKSTVACLALFATLLVADIAGAQSLSDFKDAVGREGCRAIPYSSLRSSCESKQREIDNLCKVESWTCDKFNPDGLEQQISNVKRKIEELKKAKSSLESKKSGAKDDAEKREIDAEISETKKEIEKFEDMMEGWQKKLEEERKKIKDRIYAGEKCRDARQAQAKNFEEAKSKAKGERDEEIKPYAQKLIEKYEAGEKGHATVLGLVKKGIEKCKSML